MKVANAFTLIELMVYTTLLVFLVLLLGNFTNLVVTTLSGSRKSMISTIKVATALDNVSRDVRSSVMDTARWDADHVVFGKEFLNTKGTLCSVCVGWEPCVLKGDKQGLRRTEGVYNFITHQWGTKTVSVIAAPLTSLRIRLTVSKDRVRVEQACLLYTVHGDARVYSLVVAPRARVLR